ncbi:MAG: hypothetical protein ABSF79_09315 [Smithellaceae bacterium]
MRIALDAVEYAMVIFSGSPACFCGWQLLKVSALTARTVSTRMAKWDRAGKWIIFSPYYFKLGGQ